jgi:hypothetical protein
LLSNLRRWFLEPDPARIIALRLLDKTFGFLDYETRLKIGSIDRAVYGYGLLEAAKLARRIGCPRISAIEFGVAGGNGLLALEMHAEHIKRRTGVEIDIYGFDSGQGMPPPADHRDIPYLWQAGYFPMDEAKLRASLQHSKLVLGPIQQTVPAFCTVTKPAPIGFIVFDLDYYSSTMDAFALFEGADEYFLPRINCYFDDIVGDVSSAFNEFTGELLAITDFNAAHDDMKIAPVSGMRFFDGAIPRGWHEQVFVVHRFRHAQYATPIADLTSLPLA